MKKILAIAIICISSLLFYSCSEDFKVGAPYKEVMVVFGLLDKGDTAHYIKITRGFFDEVNNNLLAAKNADSVYYDSLKVVLSKMNNGGAVIQNYSLAKVNLVTEGIVKDTGIFVANPAYAYKLKTLLDPNYLYQLSITNPKTQKKVTCNTNVLENAPTVFVVDNLQGGILDFSDPVAVNDFIFTPPPHAAMIEMYLRFNYYEKWLVNGTEVGASKYVDIPFFTKKAINNPNNPGAISFSFLNNTFFGFIGGGLPTPTNDVKRYVDTPDVIFYAAGNDLKKYIDITNAQGGITADQIKPIYTNMQGGDAYGILSTRVKREVYQIPFSKRTVDSLIYSPNAKYLNIVGKSPI